MAQWVITTDNISDGDDVGICGPKDGFIVGAPMPHKFRLKDDDGEVYYYGRCACDSSFSPLDDFGQPNAGATSIEYRNPKTKRYEVL